MYINPYQYSNCCSPRTSTSGCVVRLPGECVYYSGASIVGPSINTGDDFNTVVNKLFQNFPDGTVTSVGLSMPAAFNVAGSPITNSGTFAVTATGTTAQYIRGDGTLSTFPTIPVLGANNGTSLSGTNVVLGQDVSQVGNPGALTSIREIPLNGQSVRFRSDLALGGEVTIGNNFLVPRIPFQVSILYDINAAALPLISQTSHLDTRYNITDSNITLNGKENLYAAMLVQGREAVTIDTDGGDLFQGVRGSLVLRQATGYTGTTNYTISIPTESIDAATAICGSISVSRNTGGTVNVDGFLSSFNSALVMSQNNTVLEHYVAYNIGAMLVSGGAIVENTYLFKDLAGPGIGTVSNWGIYIESSTKTNFFGGPTGFGTNTMSSSAQVQINSTSRGFLPPRMTTVQKNAIASPVAGLMVYDTTLNKLCVYTTAWETITSS